MKRFTSQASAWLAQWVRICTARPVWLLLVAVLSGALAALYLAEHVRIDTNNEDMLAPNLPFRRDSIALSDAFPQFSDNLLIVVEAPSQDEADDAASALANALARDRERYRQVSDPEGDPFLRRNALLYLDPDALNRRADDLARALPFLGPLARDLDLRGLLELLARAANDAGRASAIARNDLVRFVDALTAETKRMLAGRPGKLSWSNLLQTSDSGTGSAGPARHLLRVEPNLDFGSLDPAAAAMEGVRQTARALHLTPDQGFRVRLTGSAALSSEELGSVRAGLGWAGGVSVALVAIGLVLGLGSLSAAAAVLFTLVLGLLWTGALATALVGTFNLLSVAFVVLFIGLGVDFGIHFTLRYREQVLLGESARDALVNAASGTGGALGLCALTSAIAFFSLLPTDYIGLAQLGLIAGAGMFVALGTTLTVLPALLSLVPLRRFLPSHGEQRRKAGADNGNAARPSHRPEASRWALPLAYPRATLAGFAVACAGALLASDGISFDSDPLRLKDPESESVRTLLDLHASGTPVHGAEVLAENIAQARILAHELSSLPQVDDAITLTSFIPGEQEEKLAIIDEMALVAEGAIDPESSLVDIGDPARLQARKAFLTALSERERSHESSALETITRALHRFATALERVPDTRLRELEQRLLGTLPRRIAALASALEAEPVTLGNLPASIRARYLAADGRTRIEIRPARDLMDRPARRAFVAAVRSVAPRATGSAVVIEGAERTILGALAEAGLISFSATFLLLWLVLGRLRLATLALVPVVAAGLLTLGVTALFGISFNFANVIVLPLLFGLGVDFAIHLIARAREEGTSERALHTTTPRAVALSAYTTVGSFGSIMLSHHPGTAGMGLLLTLALALGVLSSLLVVPAVLRLYPGWLFGSRSMKGK